MKTQEQHNTIYEPGRPVSVAPARWLVERIMYTLLKSTKK